MNLKIKHFSVSVTETAKEFHSVLGKAIYIPDENLLGSIPNGISFFKEIPESCLRRVNLATTVKDQTFYKNTAEFYKSIATQNNLKTNYESHFSLGFTLDATTNTVSGGKREVSGTSLNLATKTYEEQLLPNCLYETALHDRVMQDFARLGRWIRLHTAKNTSCQFYPLVTICQQIETNFIKLQ